MIPKQTLSCNNIILKSQENFLRIASYHCELPLSKRWPERCCENVFVDAGNLLRSEFIHPNDGLRQHFERTLVPTMI